MPTRVQHYDIGDLWTPQATWTVGGTPTDPTQIVVRLQNASGVETVVTTASSPGTLTTASTPLARVSAGVFKLNPGISFDAAGFWFTRFEGTGAAAATEEHQAVVDPSEFTSDGGVSSRALVGLAETKDWLNQQNIDTSDDLELVRLINDVSDRMHYEAGREFKPISTASSARTFTIDWNGVCNGIVPVGDMAAAPSQVRILADDWTTVYTTVSTSVYLAWPEVRDAWKPIRALNFNVRYLTLYAGYRCEVTSTWGFPQVPGSVRQATLDAIAEIHDREVEHYSSDLGPQTGGGETNVVVLGNQAQIFSLPPRALAVARSYRDSLVG